MQRDALRFRWGDAAAIGAVAVLAVLALLLFWAPNRPDGAKTVRIYRDGTLIRELPLGVDTTFTVTGRYENTVTIKGGAVSVTDATCPGGDCMHTGRISEVGRSIFCLPNRVEIRIAGGGGLDGVAE